MSCITQISPTKIWYVFTHHWGIEVFTTTMRFKLYEIWTTFLSIEPTHLDLYISGIKYYVNILFICILIPLISCFFYQALSWMQISFTNLCIIV